MITKVPVHAARLLGLGEEVRYLMRPRVLPLYMLMGMATIVFAVGFVSVVIEDPGFMRLLSIPAIPMLGGIVGHLIHCPVILVTNRRILSASRFFKPLSLGLEELKALSVKQNPLGRLIGYGTLVLLVHPSQNVGGGAFLKFELKKLPDASALDRAILAAAAALGT